MKRRSVSIAEKVNGGIRKPVIVVILAVSLFIQIWSAISTLNLGGEIADIEKEQKRVVAETELLKRELASKSSLTSLSKNATELGFVTTSETLYIEGGQTSAQLLR